MTNDITMNMNSAECTKVSTGWSESIYHNICTGTEITVSNGVMDKVIFVIGGSVAALVLLGVLLAAVAIYDTIRY